MRSASKRALISLNFYLCSGVSSSYVTGSPFDIPMTEVDVVGVECPTGLARMCCQPKPPTGVDRQHESQEARSLYPSALQLTRALRLEFIGHAS
jgi:hypothetical protein